MKRTVISVLSVTALASLLVLDLVTSLQAGEGCSEGTLQGRYLATGRAEQDNAIFAGVWTFDGEGNISWLETSSHDGDIRRRTTGRGTYRLGSDCIGTVRIGQNTADIFVSRDGNVANLIRTDEGTIATREFKRDNDK